MYLHDPQHGKAESVGALGTFYTYFQNIFFPLLSQSYKEKQNGVTPFDISPLFYVDLQLLSLSWR